MTSPRRLDVLTDREARFIAAYLIKPDAKAAAITAGYATKAAVRQGYRLMQIPRVKAAIEAARAERSERTKITADMVLQRWWDIATANPNELIQFRRTCCRFCHGTDHAFQWKDEAEWSRALISAQARAGDKPGVPLPENSGGYGYDATLDPHAECPGCNGEGVGEVHAEDTRKLSSVALALYAGVKATKDGLEIKMQDQGAALANVAKHLGMFVEKVEHDVRVRHVTDISDAELAAIARGSGE